MKIFLRLLFFSISFFILNPGCTIQKRNYQKGYYVSYDKKRSKTKDVQTTGPLSEKEQAKPEEEVITEYVTSSNKADAFFKT
jgi:hypothetical protein